MRNKIGQALSWWGFLTDKEQEILINVLYNLELRDYVQMDEDGNILKLKEVE